MNRSFFMPTRVIFDEKCIEKNSHEFKRFGKKALIVTGRRSASVCGALGDVTGALKNLSIPFEIYNGIMPNPDIENVRKATEQARMIKADMVIGIGGGSPMDAAKAVAMLSVHDLDDESLFSGPYHDGALPVIAIPTTSGTGSEVTPYSILTDTGNRTKKNLCHASLFPKVAFLDPRYTIELSYEITLNTAVDALSHSIESALSKKTNRLSFMLAMESLQAIGPSISKMNPDQTLDYEDRQKLLYGSMLAGMAIAQTGTTAVHAMGYCLTFFKNMDHGKANGMLLAEYLRYVKPENRNKIDQIVSALGLTHFKELESMLIRHMPQTVHLTEQEIDMFADQAILTKSVENTHPVPTIDDIRMIYRNSLGSRSVESDTSILSKG